MPRYFIDTNDGEHEIRDDEGVNVPHANAAREMAIQALPDMARDVIPDGDHRVFTVSVKSETGDVIYVATLTLSGGWTSKATLPSGRQRRT